MESSRKARTRCKSHRRLGPEGNPNFERCTLKSALLVTEESMFLWNWIACPTTPFLAQGKTSYEVVLRAADEEDRPNCLQHDRLIE
jgi:hypothetical protein